MTSHSLQATQDRRSPAQQAREEGWVYVAYEETLQNDPLWVRVSVKTYICWSDFKNWARGWVRGKGWPS